MAVGRGAGRKLPERQEVLLALVLELSNALVSPALGFELSTTQVQLVRPVPFNSRFRDLRSFPHVSCEGNLRYIGDCKDIVLLCVEPRNGNDVFGSRPLPDGLGDDGARPL
jgi:hypothetical protein